MKTVQWNALKLKNRGKYFDEYSKFMGNRKNKRKCSNCPENEGLDSELPCGKQQCLVEVNCEDMELM